MNEVTQLSLAPGEFFFAHPAPRISETQNARCSKVIWKGGNGINKQSHINMGDVDKIFSIKLPDLGRRLSFLIGDLPSISACAREIPTDIKVISLW